METETPSPEKCSTNSTRDAAFAYRKRGWSSLPLPFRSKNPGGSVGDGWQKLRIVEGDIPKFFNGAPQNIGVLLGDPSNGLCDCDLDCSEALALADAMLPKTNAVFGRKSTPKAHYLYYCIEIQRIHQFKDTDGSMLVELRSTGGQTVFPPSVHPEGEQIEWQEYGDPLEISKGDLLRAIHQLAIASLLARHWPVQGSREEAALAFAGMLLRAGVDAGEAESILRAATRVAGDEEYEKRAATVRSTQWRIEQGDTAIGGTRLGELIGKDVVKLISKLMGQTASTFPLHSGAAAVVGGRPDILIPGGHPTPLQWTEISTDDFSTNVIDALPLGSMYVRGDIPGEVVGEAGVHRFVPLIADRTRILIDRHERLVEWKQKGYQASITYKPCSRDHAQLVLGRALDHVKVPELRTIVKCPSFVGSAFERAVPGFNPKHGVFYDEHPSLRDIKPIRDRVLINAILEDLLIDFPLQSRADWENFVGLLLTLILRPAIIGNIPLHLLLSCLERSGKTKLVEQVVGITIQGSEIPALTLTDKEEECEKRILALLLAGVLVVHLDNLPRSLDSAVLSSLLTATFFQGRVLGVSRMACIRNDVVFVGSGNNVRASSEMSKRIVPIRLLPDTARPEERTNFRHPDLRGFLESARPSVLGALLGMIMNWIDGGRPSGSVLFGGFEGFASVIGGIMQIQGYDTWLANRAEWVGDADLHGGDLERLVEIWGKENLDWVKPEAVVRFAEAEDLFPDILSLSDEHQRRTLFGKRVLLAATNRPVGLWRVEGKGTGSSRRYRLVPLAKERP